MRQRLQQFSFSLKHKYCQFSCSSKKVSNFLPAFKNDPPIVGILFPVPQIMIRQLRGILFSIPQNFLLIYLFMPAFENDLPIVGIIFPVPQIMIHQLLGILFLASFSVPQIVIQYVHFNNLGVVYLIFYNF